MKIFEAIEEIDKLKPNLYGPNEKIKWLSRLDMKVQIEQIDTHEQEEPREAFKGYTDDDMDKQLLVGEPWDEMYIHWLSAQIDFNNREFENFNASNAMFESVYSSFRNAYNQSHMPIGTKKTYY